MKNKKIIKSFFVNGLFLILLAIISILIIGCEDLLMHIQEDVRKQCDINVRVGNTDIPNGGSHDVGYIIIDETKVVIFTIENKGHGVDLHLTGNPSVALTDNSFSVKEQPQEQVIKPGKSLDFEVNFKPIDVTEYVTTITIKNDDKDEGTYSFKIKGTVYPTPFYFEYILHASDLQDDDRFGRSVEISGDYAIVGAYWEDGGAGDPHPDAGAAYIFDN